MSQEGKPVVIVMVEDDEGHARLIERNIRRAGVNNRDDPFHMCTRRDFWDHSTILLVKRFLRGDHRREHI